MRSTPFLRISIYLAAFIFLLSCKKAWLEEKPDLSLALPTTIQDYQSLLDNSSSAGNAVPFNINQTIFDEYCAGDFYVSDADLNSRGFTERSVYTWQKEMYSEPDENNTAWSSPYKRIFYSNVILEGINKITPKSSNEVVDWNQVKGSALFFRGYNHFQIANLYCKPYNTTTASSDLGIPLRLESDFNIQSRRSSVEETYNQIILDIKESINLLPISAPQGTLYKLRPTKSAASALLARIYLSMSNYDSAFVYADRSLQLHSFVMDYNSLTVTSTNFPIAQFSTDEVSFYSQGITYILFTFSRLNIDTSLYNLYDANDLRKSVYFKVRNGILTYFGSYAGSSGTLFAGFTTGEMYLIRAECYARKGNVVNAMSDVNYLRQKRWKNTVPYPALNAGNSTEAIGKILLERRKELCFRGLRWSDLRRLNMEPQFATTLSKFSNGQTYSLIPNSPRYVFSIPPDVIRLSGMQQNER